jgi:hypothetical protein
MLNITLPTKAADPGCISRESDILIFGGWTKEKIGTQAHCLEVSDDPDKHQWVDREGLEYCDIFLFSNFQRDTKRGTEVLGKDYLHTLTPEGKFKAEAIQ